MGESRSALIVATRAHEDVGLTRLQAPGRDAEALSEVLGDPDIGGFDVRTVLDQPSHVVNVEVARFFANRKPDELLLLHFSCHGVKDDSGELYFATTDTRLDLLEATAVSSAFVNKVMNRSRSSRVVLLLDCCYAGAFARGLVARATPALDLGERLGGRGRAVITASTALQFAFEGTDLAEGDVEREQPSVFTRALVTGLRSGEADRDLDGMVSLDELYGYMYDEVTATTPHQTPGKWVFGLEGDLYVARRSTPVTTPSDLEKEVVESLESAVSWQRGAAIPELERLLRGSHPGRALAARQALERLADDDSRQVAVAARTVLAAHLPAQRTSSEQFTVTIATQPQTDVTAAIEPSGSTEPPKSSARTTDRESTKSADSSRRTSASGPTAHPLITLPPPVASAPTPWWRARRVTGSMLAALVLLVLAAVAWLHADAPTSDGPGSDEPRLANTTLVVSEFTDEGSQLLALDTRTGEPISTFPTVRGRLPLISPDRRWVIYVGGADATASLESKKFVLYRIRADGSDNKRWLKPTGRCRYASRPTWNPNDPSQLAVTCLDRNEEEVGIWRVSASGRLGDPLVEDRGVRAAPTWTGNGTVVYTFNPDAGPTVLERVQTDGTNSRSLVGGLGGDPEASVFDPDWSDEGLLFTRAPAFREAGTGLVKRRDGSVTELEGGSSTKFTTFSPDGGAVAWLRANTSGDSYTLLSGGMHGAMTEIAEGRFEQPAWGSR